MAAKPPRLPSDRSFGFVVAGAFAAILAQGLIRGHGPRVWALALAAAALGLALVRPRLLRPFNRAWMALGRAVGRVVSPIALGIVYFGVVTPVGLVARLRGRDPLGRRFPTDAKSHWQKREPVPPESLERPY